LPYDGLDGFRSQIENNEKHENDKREDGGEEIGLLFRNSCPASFTRKHYPPPAAVPAPEGLAIEYLYNRFFQPMDTTAPEIRRTTIWTD
jgi:hypothetical protein